MRKILLISLITLLTTLSLFAQTHTAWVETYSCGPYTTARDITVDKSGYVYVTGECCMDYITIKYYPDGDTAWARKYNSPGYGEDLAYAIAVDDSGNVFVTGVTGYFSSGTEPYDDITTIKYYPNGDTAWVRYYTRSENSQESGRDIVVDFAGNCYVTGYSHGGRGCNDYDYVTIKYYPDGDTAWLRRYNGPGDGWDWAHAIAIDDSGNVYVTGEGSSCGVGWDCTTVKYDSSGNEIWVRRYNGTANCADRGFDIAVDKDGNICVAGQIHNSITGYDCGTIKYDPNGNELWVRTYSGVETNSEDRAYGLVVDDSSNVYVSGRIGYYPDYDYLTIMYDPTGNEKWVRTYDGPANSQDEAVDISLDNSGNIYVTGWSAKYSGDPWSFDYATVIYDQNGNELCVKRYGGPVAEMAFALVVDDSSNVFVTGTINGASCTTVKYFPVGMAGDVNGDVKVSIFDVFYLLDYLYRGADIKNTLSSSDVNDDGSINLKDVVYLLNYLFKGGPPPIC